MDKESPEAGKRRRDFLFWDGFEAGNQSTGSLPDLHLHFTLERDGRTEERFRVTRSARVPVLTPEARLH